MFKYYPSSLNLQPYIQGYLEADYRTSLESGKHTLFPNGYSGVFFNFGNQGKLKLKEEYKTPDVSVYGQIDHHFEITHLPGFYSFGVLLKPTLLSWLLQVNMSEFTNCAFDGKLINQALKDLREQMDETKSAKQKIQLFEEYFIHTLILRPYRSTLSDYALAFIHQKKYSSVSDIAQHLQVSQRYIETHFKKTVGLSPKTYSLIMRFKNMESQLKKLSTIHWQDMEFAYEYYDQNHFIKDFKRFTGITPTDYLIGNFDMVRSYLL